MPTYLLRYVGPDVPIARAAAIQRLRDMSNAQFERRTKSLFLVQVSAEVLSKIAQDPDWDLPLEHTPVPVPKR